MHIVKRFLVALAIVLVSGSIFAQGGIVYQHGGAHHRTTVVIPLGGQQQYRAQQYRQGTRLHVLCRKPGWPVDVNGQPACRLPDGQLEEPLSVEVEVMGNGGYNNHLQGPRPSNVQCPPGTGRSPWIMGQGYQGGSPCW